MDARSARQLYKFMRLAYEHAECRAQPIGRFHYKRQFSSQTGINRAQDYPVRNKRKGHSRNYRNTQSLPHHTHKGSDVLDLESDLWRALVSCIGVPDQAFAIVAGHDERLLRQFPDRDLRPPSEGRRLRDNGAEFIAHERYNMKAVYRQFQQCHSCSSATRSTAACLG